jgi:homoserine O-acetyltransferase
MSDEHGGTEVLEGEVGDLVTSGEQKIYELSEPLELESGEVLSGVRVAYRTWGSPAAEAVLVCHALTGSADAFSWWAGLFGPGRALDPARDFIVCSNVLGSCYGTTGPASIRGADFPAVTIRDIVRVQHALVRALRVRRLNLVLGGSLGGMQVLEWALLYPEMVEAIAPIAVSGRHSAWCIGLSEAQRQALYADPLWQSGRYAPEAPPAAGLAAARAVAMCTYRSRGSFEERFGRRLESSGLFHVERYLRHQGAKLAGRFDANSYVTLTRAMDSHDVGRGRNGSESALRSVRQRALVVGIDSDVLYPPEEQRELAAGLSNARLAWLRSPQGHDAFLIETEALNRLLVDFRASLDKPRLAGPILLPAQREDDRTVRVVVAGATGRVGSRLCEQLGRLEEGSRLRLVGALNRRRLAWNDAGLDPLRVPEALEAGGPSDWESLDALLGSCEEPLVLVDCTASPEVAERYPLLLAAGIGVVTPNKLAGSGDFERWRLLRELSLTRNAPWRYETTVGAALPVLGPLADLRRAGDRLVSLTAILSGSLSFVLHRVNEGTPFSAAVAEAHRLGFTEPHPREDLSGQDVARKLLILLRESGFGVERDEVIIEPMISDVEEEDPERFLAGLVQFDAAWTGRAAEARARGERLFHVARFDTLGETGPQVGVASLPAVHPVGRAGPGENVVVIRTDRYSGLPLTLSGPGAGPEITASGVLIDLLGAAEELRRRPPF